MLCYDKGVFSRLDKKLAYSTDRQASMFEATIFGIIKRALSDAMAPLSFTIDSLHAR